MHFPISVRPFHLRPPAGGPRTAGTRDSRHARRGLAGAVAAVLVVLGAPGLAAAGQPAAADATVRPAQAPDELTHDEHSLLEAIDTDYIVGHIKHIEDEIGPGLSGSPAERRRADYFASELATLGYAPWTHATAQDGTADYIQEFPLNSTAIVGSVTVAGHEYPATGPSYSQNGVYHGDSTPEVTGETVYFATPADAIAAPQAEVEGKVVLTNRPAGSTGNNAYAAPARDLEAKGAVAVVFLYSKYTVTAAGKTSAESLFSAVTSGTPINIPVALIPYFEGQSLLAALTDQGGVVASASATVRNSRATTSVNVLAVKPAARSTNRTVVIGGHLDSVRGAIGANDNLSGPSTILGIAKAIKDVPTAYNIVFAFWGSEEAGLLGSKAFYASTLAPDAYWKNIVAYYNLDMAATSQESNSYLTVHTPYHVGPGNAGPLRSWAGDKVAEQGERYWAYANANGQLDSWWKKEWVDPATGQVGVIGLEYYGNCSDHASIAGANANPSVGFDAAIPQVYTFWRDAGVNTRAGGVTELNYHVVGDRLAWPGDEFTIPGESHPYTGNISPERAGILASVYALALVDTANGPVYPQALNLQATGDKSRVRVAWDATEDGGSDITEHTLTLIPSGGGDPVTATAEATATSHTFENVPVGDYTVTATVANAAGTSPKVTSGTVTVAASTAPAAPPAPTLTGGHETLTASWAPPVDDGGSAITAYELEFSDGTVVRRPAGATSHRLVGVEPGDYSVTVKAINAIGASPAATSDQATVEAQGAPAAVTTLNATPGVRQLALTWSAPDHNGVALTGYTVTLSGGQKAELAGKATSHTFTGLAPGSYTVTITAENTKGVSPGQTAGPFLVTGKYVALALTPDLTGDKRGDALAVSAGGQLHLYKGGTGGSLAGPTTLVKTFAKDSEAYGAGDLNSDGKADVLVVDAAGKLWLHPGDGKGGLRARKEVGHGFASFRVVPAGDITSDGKPDLLAVDSAGKLWLYAGNGRGGWARPRQVGHGWHAGLTLRAAGDLTRDGRADLLVVDQAGNLYRYDGRGDGTFRSKVKVGYGWGRVTLVTGADLDGDRVADIVGVTPDGAVNFYRNNGRGAFGAKRSVGTGW